MAYDVAVLIGSLRKDSFTKRLVSAIAGLAPPSLSFRFVDLSATTLYNQDLETETPPADWVKLRNDICGADAVLFATPEYNRSIPGVLKNAIDIGSRPYGKSLYSGKPAAVISASPGAAGAFGAHHHLRQTLVFLDMPTLQQPEMYIGNVANLVNEQGVVTNEESKAYFKRFADAFAAWIERHKK